MPVLPNNSKEAAILKKWYASIASKGGKAGGHRWGSQEASKAATKRWAAAKVAKAWQAAKPPPPTK